MEYQPMGALLDRLRAEQPLGEGDFLSLPVAFRRDDRRYDAFFVCRREEGKGKNPAILRPHLWMMLPADGGPDKMVSWCRVLDFLPTADYPLDSAVSAQLPKALSDRKYEALRTDLVRCYGQLRQFAFEESLSREQVEVIVTYKELFGRLCHEGLYPFYHALTPGFFHWLRLPLPGGRGTRLQGDLEPVKEYQYQLLILENLKQLVDRFEDKIQTDRHKERLFDELHSELQSYRNGLLDRLTIGMERDVIHLIDAVNRAAAAFGQREATPGEYRRLLSQLEGVGTDLQDLLYRHGVDPYETPGDEVRVERQKIISTLPTEDPGKHRHIARRLAPGWEKGTRIIRPEQVAVYLYEGTQPVQEETEA